MVPSVVVDTNVMQAIELALILMNAKRVKPLVISKSKSVSILMEDTNALMWLSPPLVQMDIGIMLRRRRVKVKHRSEFLS